MRLSGFSFVRDGLRLYYPVVESIRSILPIVDEFVVAVGRSSAGDLTRDAIAAIGDPKIRILDTVWDESHFSRGAVNAIQTDIARAACQGDWLFYLQADEVVHERYLDVVRRRCDELLPAAEVEGLLFRSKHFWGDYEHYLAGHCWYPREIRVVRNRPEIRSWHSAQSFRWYDRYEHPWQQTGTRKLRVASVDAEIYHYGWVRPPRLMQAKNKALNALHDGTTGAESKFAAEPVDFDYGDLSKIPLFQESYPAVMAGRILQMDWREALGRASSRPAGRRPKHERLRYRVLDWIERRLFGGTAVFASRNYELLSR